MIKVAASTARQEFAAVLRKVQQGKRFLLEKHDKGVAAIVSVEDLRFWKPSKTGTTWRPHDEPSRKSPRKGQSLGRKPRRN